MNKLSILMLIPLLWLSACNSTYPNQNLTGQPLIALQGSDLNDKPIDIATLLQDPYTLLLVGYVQDSQFDIDRWLIGVDMAKLPLKVYELPAIKGMLPRMFKTYINNGMRRGIPKPLWGGVITLYQDGEKLQRFSGNINPNNARVLLVQSNGNIAYFYDQGFSVAALNQLKSLLE